MASLLWLVRSISLAKRFSPGLSLSRTIIKETHAAIYCGEGNSIGFPAKGSNPHSLPSAQIKTRTRVTDPSPSTCTLVWEAVEGPRLTARSQDAGFNPALLEDVGPYLNLLGQQVL